MEVRAAYDYPYWDFYRNVTLPTRINSSLPLNAQAIILIDEFTDENGATAWHQLSERLFIQIKMVIFGKCIRLTGKPGDMVLFFAAA